MTEHSTPMYDFSVLRELRKRDCLNIADVSERSSVSAAVISKLERNQTQPNLDTLYRLARVFGMHPSDLLKLAESQSAHKRIATERVSDGISFQEIRYGNARCLLGTAPKNSKVSRPQIHGDDYEICWVLSGKLQFHLPHETHALSPGQSIQFDAILEHTYEALEDSTFIIIHLSKGKRF